MLEHNLPHLSNSRDIWYNKIQTKQGGQLRQTRREKNGLLQIKRYRSNIITFILFFFLNVNNTKPINLTNLPIVWVQNRLQYQSN